MYTLLLLLLLGVCTQRDCIRHISRFVFSPHAIAHAQNSAIFLLPSVAQLFVIIELYDRKTSLMGRTFCLYTITLLFILNHCVCCCSKGIYVGCTMGGGSPATRAPDQQPFLPRCFDV